MKLESKRFGKIEVMEDRILTLKGGLLGFSELNRFVLLDDLEDPNIPFKWLVSVDDPEYGFLVTDPGIFFKDYVFDLSEDDRDALDVRSEDDVTVITILTVPSDPKKITANLNGPLVFNNRTRSGKQVILANSDYTTKHYIFIQANEEATEAQSTQSTEVAGASIDSEAGLNKEVITQS